MTTEDVAAFGQLYLQRGRWHGRQLVPESWVEDATAPHVSNGDPTLPSDWTQGYGFQFWRSRHGGYRGDGAFGQLCLVMPEQGTVVAVTAGLPDMQHELDVVWETLLPALGDTGALPSDPDAQARLTRRLEGLSLPTPEGAASSTWLDRVSGVRYVMDGDAVSGLCLTARDAGLELVLTGRGLDARVVCGHARWVEDGSLTADLIRTGTDRGPSPLAGSFAWVADDRLAIRMWATDTALGWDAELAFDGGLVDLTMRQNVAFTTPPVIRATGVAVPPR